MFQIIEDPKEPHSELASATDEMQKRLIPKRSVITGEAEMKITEVGNVPSKPNPHGVDVRNISDTESAQVVHITLEPGEALKKHITPVDVVFYVLEGSGVVEIGEERKEVGSDTLIESPARIPHRWSNESSSRLRILVLKTPRPKESTKIL